MEWIRPTTLLALALLLCSLTASGSALKCWDCDHEMDKVCMEPFDNTTLALTDCDIKLNAQGKPVKCKKVKKFDGSLTLSCILASEVNITSNCIEGKDDKGNYQETCYCDQSDGCNGLVILSINEGSDNSTKNNTAFSTVPLFGMVTLVPLAIITYAMP